MAAEAVLREESLAVWREYRRTRDVGLRNSLVLRHMGLVYQIANRYAPLARDSADDLIQEGCLGLIRAIERFRPEYGVQFSTYAYPVISGTIKNYLRQRRRLLGHPSWEEVAAGRSGGSVPQGRGEELVAPESLEALVGAVEEDFADQVVDRLLTTALLRRLPRLERRIISHLFYEDLTQREVARVVSRSASRISRILRRALDRVRLLLADIQAEEDRLPHPAGEGILLAGVVDPETKLFGPEHLKRSLLREMRRARALGAPLSLALLSPNGGSHPVTPAMLSALAGHIYRQVRVLDHVFRASESELGLVLSLPGREAAAVCDRVRNGGLRDELCWAVAVYPQDADSVTDLLAAARERMVTSPAV